MMISEGSGMHALSIAIIRTTPPYPSAEIVATIKPESAVISLSIIWERVAWREDGCEHLKLHTRGRASEAAWREKSQAKACAAKIRITG